MPQPGVRGDLHVHAEKDAIVTPQDHACHAATNVEMQRQNVLLQVRAASGTPAEVGGRVCGKRGVVGKKLSRDRFVECCARAGCT
jgi:hypothetical protein